MSDGTYCVATGDGPPLVLVHGVGLDHTMWNQVTTGLAERHTVIRYDLWGHGRSIDPSGPRTLGHFVDQLVTVLDDRGVETAHVLGLSLGALVARDTAIAHPRRVDHLVLANCVHRRDDAARAATRHRLELTRRDGLAPIADLAIARWFDDGFRRARPELVDAIHHRLVTTPLDGYVKAYAVFCEADDPSTDALATVRAPTLVLTGALDVGSTPAMTDELAADIPHATALVLDDVHHLPPVEDPDAFTSAVLAFLAEETSP